MSMTNLIESRGRRHGLDTSFTHRRCYIYEKAGRRASSRPLGAFKIGWASKASVDDIHIDIDYDFDRRRSPALSTSDILYRHII